ncbi:MAG: sensor histidine kinase [Gemmatimonadaceae bacterium]
MASIRYRLTVAYAAALIGTMAAFALALWVARRAALYRDLEEYVVERADEATTIIEQAIAAGEPVTVTNDSLVGPIITQALRDRLEGVPEHLLILDEDGRLLYSSFDFRQLDPDGRATLQSAGLAVSGNGHGALVQLGEQELYVAARSSPGLGPTISRAVAAASTRPYQLGPAELVGTTLVVSPLILAVSIAVAYVIAGRAFRPIDRIINEVEAISDGRSLHRRLVVEEESNDELSRLTATLNAMIGRLETSFSGLRRFTADASHELKTPLTVLRADVERAMMSSGSSTDQFVALEEALQETARMSDLVDSLLTLARADEGRFDLHREPVALDPLVREVFETASILGEDAGLTVELPVADSATVMGERPRLRQLLLNLVTNAIKYTPRGGRVELTLARRDREVSFVVHDTGVGISAADLPHVFERFFRADRARSRSTERGGFGLGLAISQWIVQAHGGHLTVTSRLGRGSTFTVTLPVAVDAETPAEPGEPEPDSATGAARPEIA